MTEPDSKEQIDKSWGLLADGNTGKITKQSLKMAAEAIGEDMTDEELGEMIKLMDYDKDGQINYDEFLRVMKKAGISL